MSVEETTNEKPKYRTRMEEIEIPKDNPFEFDLLDRQPHIETLTSFINGVANPTVIALNGRWGDGKTTFIKMWKQHLNNEGTRSIYFNAWESDLFEDAFSAIFGEISSNLGFNLSGKDRDIGEVVDHLFKRIIYNLLSSSIKAVSLGAVNIDNEIQTYRNTFIDDYENFKKSMPKFKQILTKKVSEQSGGKPLVLFIDELDRCRPPFAIEILEKMKHIFNIDNIVFVLSTNIDQLQHSVKSVYGSDIDAKGYLSRFIDLHVELPVYREYDIIDDLLMKGVWPTNEIRTEIISLARGFTSEIFNLVKTSVRDTEKIIILATTVFSSQSNVPTSSGEKNLLFQFILFLAIIKHYDISLLKRMSCLEMNTPNDYTTINQIRDYEIRKQMFLFMYLFDSNTDSNYEANIINNKLAKFKLKIKVDAHDINSILRFFNPSITINNANYILSFSAGI